MDRPRFSPARILTVSGARLRLTMPPAGALSTTDCGLRISDCGFEVVLLWLAAAATALSATGGLLGARLSVVGTTVPSCFGPATPVEMAAAGAITLCTAVDTSIDCGMRIADCGFELALLWMASAATSIGFGAGI